MGRPVSDQRHWLFVPLGLQFAVPTNFSAQPVPHHFEGIAVSADQTVTLTLGGSVSNMFTVTGAVSNQFRQLFDLYVVETSTNLRDWSPLVSRLRTDSDPNPLIAQNTYLKGESPPFPTNPEIYGVLRK